MKDKVTTALQLGIAGGVGGWWFMVWQARTDDTIDRNSILWLPAVAWLCYAVYLGWVAWPGRGQPVWPFTALVGLVTPLIVVAVVMIAASLLWGGTRYVRSRRTGTAHHAST